jgi:uncharacterized protein YbjT (DUF2867 family)
MSSLSRILVTGGTGQQGGAVAKALKTRGFEVRCLTRSPKSPAALDLTSMAIEVVEGDMGDPVSLERAMQGIDAVYGMGNTWESGPQAEIQHGRNLIDAAKRSEARHFVFGSAAHANKRTGLPHLDSKAIVEAYLEDSGVPFTVLAPVAFMENILRFGLGSLSSGTLAFNLPNKPIQQVALADLASLVVEVFLNPSRFLNQRLDVASAVVSGSQMAATLTATLGRTISYFPIPRETIVAIAGEEAGNIVDWFDEHWNNPEFLVDIYGLHRAFPKIAWHSFDQWARDQDWRKFHV